MARLQRSRGVQAGTVCHEGGIILSKKPPEWHLSRRINDLRPILMEMSAMSRKATLKPKAICLTWKVGLAEILLYLPLQSMSYGQFIQESQEQ